MDDRVRHFSKEIGNSLSSCSLAARESHKTLKSHELDSHEPDSSVEKVEHLALFAKELEKSDAECGRDPIDLVFILDISNTEVREFEEQKRISMDLIKQAPVGDVGSRVRVGITVFNQFARTFISLNNTLNEEELLFNFERLQNSGSQTSAVAGIFQGISDISNFRRIGARLVVLIISNKSSKDGASRIQKAGNLLRKSGAEVFAISLNKTENEEELKVYTDSKKRVFSGEKISLFVLSSKKIVFGCSIHQREKQLADITIAGQEEGEIENIENLDKVTVSKASAGNPEDQKEDVLDKDDALLNTKVLSEDSSKDPNLLKTITLLESSTDDPKIRETTPLKSFTNEQGREMFRMETTEEPEQHIKTLFSDDCTVDLMFIIDTSQSVAEEFQKQLQFAVDLVNRLPNEDFESRVNVAVVSFYKTAKVEFPFGQVKEKSKVLEALSKIDHTGGSTSAVSGVNLAVEEIKKGRRPGARLMVVLVSDGNSQDLWEDVVSASEKLRELKADVYAVTVSHDYFFRELELYAGNKWFVYIDARIRQFLDEAEMSVMECRNPSIPSTNLEAVSSLKHPYKVYRIELFSHYWVLPRSSITLQQLWLRFLFHRHRSQVLHR